MSVAACPGCATAPEPAPRASALGPSHTLVLPGIHCAGCIAGVERALTAIPEITAARVNLTEKRVAITATPGLDPTPWITALAKAGYEAYEAQDRSRPRGPDLLLPLGVSGFAMMNVMLLSVAVWSGATETTRDFLHWVTAAIALPATAYAAQPFFRSAFAALRGGRLNMDVPISLAIILACGMSLYEVMLGGEHAWFDAALALTFFLLAGRVLDQRLRRAARSTADNLAALEPSRTLRLEDGVRISRALDEIGVGDRLWLAAGSRVPVDTVLTEGTAEVDASFLTGESAPVTRRAGEPLYAGEVVLSGPITLTATAVGENTKLRQVAQLVAVAEGARGVFHTLADRAAAIYTPAVHIISAAALLGWLIATGDLRMALNVAIATLIITCPCALGLAVPAMGVAATSRLFREGVLVTSDTALERVAGVDTVVFDKTGTLTTRSLVLPEDLPKAALPVLKALADASDHPLCVTLAKSLEDVEPAPLKAIREDVGQGVFARHEGEDVSLARDRCDGQATEFVIGDRAYQLMSREEILPGAETAVARLKALGLSVHLLTGDAQEAADATARALGIDSVSARVLPEDKMAVIERLEADGARVLMVGDGLNDTAALARASASMAPGSALDASRSAADMIYATDQVLEIPRTIEISRTARRRILQNFGLAVAYNCVSVPIAVLGFASPLAAALAMSTSSICVILNSLRRIRA
ncbi:MAG: heavy metal translocating P-type ATPase [Pseudomonadota bacterium]